MSFIEEMQAARENTVSHTVNLKDLVPKTKEAIEIGGKLIPISPSAFKDLLKISGITNAMLVHLNDTINPNAGFLLIKELTKAIGAKGSKQRITLVIDKVEQKVIRIAFDIGGDSVPVSPGAIENLLRELTNTNKVELTQTLITDSGTKVSFNVKWDVEIPLKMPGETISYGKQITWDMFADVTAVDMIERQVCLNGMTAIVPGNHEIKLNSESDPSAWYNTLYKELLNPNKKVLDHYESKALNAMQTALSVYEFNKIKAHALNIWRDDVEKIIRHIGDDREWKAQYQNKGIDLEKATAGQLRNCPTPVNAWDAINMLTDLASHTYTTMVSPSSKKATQKLAGQILNSNFDENSWITNVPNFGKVSKIK